MLRQTVWSRRLGSLPTLDTGAVAGVPGPTSHAAVAAIAPADCRSLAGLEVIAASTPRKVGTCILAAPHKCKDH